MRQETDLVCKPMRWRGREAFLLQNDVIRLVTLTSGGHIAGLQFRPGFGRSMMNPLWVPNWKTMDPYRYRESKHAAAYGPTSTGKMLSGIAGHNLCLDYFGLPSDEEARLGLSIHGEAPSLRWRKLGARSSRNEVSLELGVQLPQARLRFRRTMAMRRGESVVYFRETVENEAKIDHLFHWTQHVTLGTPFLDQKHSRVFISGTRGRTFPGGYEGKELLASGRDFVWPQAPGARNQTIDLSRPLVGAGRGFVATVLLNPQRDDQYVGALNTPERLMIAYCFSRLDFPWAAVWEENRARTDAPWNGQAQTRGLEFGSTPFPAGRHDAFANGPLFGAPHFSMIPARGSVTVKYAAFLSEVPAGLSQVDNVRAGQSEILIEGRNGKSASEAIRVQAGGLPSAINDR